VEARARFSLAVEDEDSALANTAVSTRVTASAPVVVERAMYWPGGPQGWAEGHCSGGVPSSGLRWGLADGRAGGPLAFETCILVASSSNLPAEILVSFLRQDADPVERRYTVAPTSRFDIPVGVFVPELDGTSFGAVIESTDGTPIVVERAMYWSALGTFWSGGTSTVAMRLPGQGGSPPATWPPLQQGDAPGPAPHGPGGTPGTCLRIGPTCALHFSVRNRVFCVRL
jgi:hypothetical protein